MMMLCPGPGEIRYLLCMEERIVKIDLSFAPDKAQQDQIVEALEEI